MLLYNPNSVMLVSCQSMRPVAQCLCLWAIHSFYSGTESAGKLESIYTAAFLSQFEADGANYFLFINKLNCVKWLQVDWKHLQEKIVSLVSIFACSPPCSAQRWRLQLQFWQIHSWRRPHPDCSWMSALAPIALKPPQINPYLQIHTQTLTL